MKIFICHVWRPSARKVVSARRAQYYMVSGVSTLPSASVIAAVTVTG